MLTQKTREKHNRG